MQLRMLKRRWIVLVAVATALIVGWCCRDYRFHRVTQYKCSRCRVIEHVSTWFGHDFVRIEETDYSHWFAKSHPQHEHHWCWIGSAKSWALYYVALGDGVQHPVWMIPPEDQKRFIETASPQDVEKFYACMDSPDLGEERKGAEMISQAPVTK